MSELRCKKKIMRGSWHSSSCTRAQWKDGFCKQHHPSSVEERNVKSKEQYEKKMAASAWARLARAQEEIAELKARIKKLENGSDD